MFLKRRMANDEDGKKCPKHFGLCFFVDKQHKVQICIGKAAFSRNAVPHNLIIIIIFFLGNAAVWNFCAILVAHCASMLCPVVVPLVDGGPLLYIHTCLSACP